MPYVKGSGWDAATEQLAEGFATGRRVGLAKQELAQRAKAQADVLELQKARAEIEAAQEMRAKSRHEQELVESKERIAAVRQAAMIQRGNFETGRLEDAKAAKAQEDLRANSAELDRAAELTGIGSLDDIATAFPELGQQVNDARVTMGDLKSPKARALYGLDRAKALGGMAKELGKKKAKEQIKTTLRRNYLGGENGEPNEAMVPILESVLAALDVEGPDGLDPKQAIDILEKARTELVEDESDVEARQMGTRALKEQHAGLMATDPDKARQVLSIINNYKRNPQVTYKQTTDEIYRTLTPQKVPGEGQDPNYVTPAALERMIQNAAGQGAKAEERAEAEKEVRSRLERSGAKLPGSKDGGTVKKPTTQAEAQARLNELVAGGLSFEEAKAQVKKEAGGK